MKTLEALTVVMLVLLAAFLRVQHYYWGSGESSAFHSNLYRQVI